MSAGCLLADKRLTRAICAVQPSRGFLLRLAGSPKGRAGDLNCSKVAWNLRVVLAGLDLDM